MLFAGVTFLENTANTKTADTKFNNELKTRVLFLNFTTKLKKELYIPIIYVMKPRYIRLIKQNFERNLPGPELLYATLTFILEFKVYLIIV